jgi:hypothetical protein
MDVGQADLNFWCLEELYTRIWSPTKVTLRIPVLAEPHGNGKLTEGKCPDVVGLSFSLMNPP